MSKLLYPIIRKLQNHYDHNITVLNELKISRYLHRIDIENVKISSSTDNYKEASRLERDIVKMYFYK